MTKNERTCWVFVTACLSMMGWLNIAAAQTRGPVNARTFELPKPPLQSEAAQPSVPAPLGGAASEKKSLWPLKLGQRIFNRGNSGETSNDPFLGQGMEEQQRLAVELSAQAANGLAQTAAPLETGGYPWPNPIDSKAVSSAVTAAADGTTWNDAKAVAQTAASSATKSGSRLVDAVRQANARAIDRFGSTARNVPNVLSAGSAPLAPQQTAQYADTSTTENYAQQAVNKYLQRVQQEGTANGRLFNPLVEVKKTVQQSAQQTVQQTAQAANSVAANIQNQVARPMHQGVQVQQQVMATAQSSGGQFVSQVAGTLPSNQPAVPAVPSPPATPTFTGLPAQNQPPLSIPQQNRSIQLPNHVQPTTQYVPNVSAMSQVAPPQAGSPPAGPVPSYVGAAATAPTMTPTYQPQSPLSMTNVVQTTPTPQSQTAATIPVVPPATSNTAQVTATATGDPKIWGTPLHNKPEFSRSSEFPGAAMGASAVATQPAPAQPSFPAVNSNTTSQTLTGPLAIAAPNVTPSAAPATPPGLGTQEKNTRVLAIVGDQTILAGEVMARVEQILTPYRDQMTDEQYEQQAELLIQQVLPRLVENKLVFLDFLRTIPPDKIPELEAKVFEYFSEHHIPSMREKLGVETTADIDAKLREIGSSLAKQQKMFLEQFVGNEALKRNVDTSAEITHDELLAYYHAHKDDFSFPTRARWETMSVELSNFDTEEAAFNALAQLGNAVKSGEDFATVAKRGSQGPRADEGGQYDWTSEGSLRSTKISELVFSLPEGKMSRIVEADGFLHIVRVVERQQAGVEEFAAIQEKIGDKIKEERRQTGEKEYLDRLARETYVWTAYDESPLPNQTATPPSNGGWQR